MVLALLVLFATAPDAPAAQEAPVGPVLTRIAEEADAFQQNITKALTQETLIQRSALPPSRFHPRIGSAASEAPKARVRVREVVSEYSVAGLHDSDSEELVEFRQVISVDGKKVQSVESARRALSLGMKSADDRLRKHMLEELAKYGLVDIATDYGLILLAFSKRGLENMEFQPAGVAQVGADAVNVFAWKQKTSEGGELEFHGKMAAHRALTGTIWVRQSDNLPLRIVAWAESLDVAKHVIRDEATVDYVRSAHGFLTPVSVTHRHLVDGGLITENVYHYEPFKLFTSDAEIKFTEVPEEPQQNSAPPAKKK